MPTSLKTTTHSVSKQASLNGSSLVRKICPRIFRILAQSQPSQHSETNNIPQPSRRSLLTTGVATLFTVTTLPLLGQSATTLPAQAATTNGPRTLTPEQKSALETAFSSTIPKARAPVLLRLVFHDSGTYDVIANNGGANASIQYELERPENFGLKRGWGVIEQTAERLKGTVAEGLSKADLIALAGAHAVRITGGPVIDVPVGRIDAVQADPEDRLPSEQLSAPDQIKMFGAKGLSAQEMVALLGSHTLGNKGFGDPVTFDNEYYRSLLKKPWENKNDKMASMIGLPSDHVLPDDPVCRPIIQKYASDEAAFRGDFAAAYLKLTTMGAQWS